MNTNRRARFRAYAVFYGAVLLGAVGGVALAARGKGLSSRGLIALAAGATTVVAVFAVGRILRRRGIATPVRLAVQTSLAIVIGVVAAWLLSD